MRGPIPMTMRLVNLRSGHGPRALTPCPVYPLFGLWYRRPWKVRIRSWRPFHISVGPTLVWIPDPLGSEGTNAYPGVDFTPCTTRILLLQPFAKLDCSLVVRAEHWAGPQGNIHTAHSSIQSLAYISQSWVPLREAPLSESLVQSLSHVWLFETPWTAACQASLCITNFQSLLKFMSIKSVMPSNHLILCRPLLFLPSIFPIIRIFSNESVLHIKWPKYWRFSFSISPFKEYSGLISFMMDWLQSKGPSRVFSNTTVQKPQFFGTLLSLWSSSHIHTWLLEKP